MIDREPSSTDPNVEPRPHEISDGDLDSVVGGVIVNSVIRRPGVGGTPPSGTSAGGSSGGNALAAGLQQIVEVGSRILQDGSRDGKIG